MSSDIKTHTFVNGFKLIYQQSGQTIPLTSINIFCNVGSAYEVDGIRGASHLVEHMCFKGTHAIPKARDLLIQYNKIGAYFNAYTEKRYTTYVIECDNTHVSSCITTVADMLLHSEFSKKEFAKEQHVVVEENIRIKDDSQYILEKALDKYYFTGSSYQYPIDSIEYHPSETYLKYDDIYKWYKRFYHPSNMVCSIVSSLSFSHIISILKKTEFTAKIPNQVDSLYYPVLKLNIPKECSIIYGKKKGISATIINVGFHTCSHTSEDKYTIQVLKHILNGLSGRLFTAFRTKHGLTYRSSCMTTYHEHTGYLTINIQTDPKKLIHDGHNPGVMPILFKLLVHLQKNGVNTEEVRVAKGNIKGKQLARMQSISKLTEYNGIEAILSNSIIPYGKLYETCIAGITKADVDRIIKKYIFKNNMVFGIVYDHSLPQNITSTIDTLQ